MGQTKEVVPVDELVGRTVLSLTTGNKLGAVEDIFVDPLSGTLAGLILARPEAEDRAQLSVDHIHSFGQDAIMALTDDSVSDAKPALADKPLARELIGTKVITDSGQVLGHIASICVTMSPPPAVIYEIRNSLLDKILGRQIFIPASAGYALSDDRQRLIVPNETSEMASPTAEALLESGISVRSVSPDRFASEDYDDTFVMFPTGEDENTLVRDRGEDETVVRVRDEDETVVRRRTRDAS